MKTDTVIIFALFLLTGILYVYYRKSPEVGGQKLKIDLEDVPLTVQQCKDVCMIDETECLRSPYNKDLRSCSPASKTCKKECENNTHPNTNFTFKYNFITDRKQAMKKYLCDSNSLACLLMKKNKLECMTDHGLCYMNSENL